MWNSWLRRAAAHVHQSMSMSQDLKVDLRWVLLAWHAQLWDPSVKSRGMPWPAGLGTVMDRVHQGTQMGKEQ